MERYEKHLKQQIKKEEAKKGSTKNNKILNYKNKLELMQDCRFDFFSLNKTNEDFKLKIILHFIKILPKLQEIKKILNENFSSKKPLITNTKGKFFPIKNSVYFFDDLLETVYIIVLKDKFSFKIYYANKYLDIRKLDKKIFSLILTENITDFNTNINFNVFETILLTIYDLYKELTNKSIF